MTLINPEWNDRNDRELYDYLFYRKPEGKVLTDLEQRFVTTMYHYEEYASGLDGD